MDASARSPSTTPALVALDGGRDERVVSAFDTERKRMAKMTKGPAFLRFVEPVLGALKDLGGSAKSSDVTDEVLKRLELPDAELAETTANGQSRVRNQIGWARFYLSKDGLIQGSQRGRWTLTAKGANASLDQDANTASNAIPPTTKP